VIRIKLLGQRRLWMVSRGECEGYRGGKWADRVVIDREIFEDDSGRALREVEVRETWVSGKMVWGLDEEGKECWIGRIKEVAERSVD
jgi:hypothetical protein